MKSLLALFCLLAASMHTATRAEGAGGGRIYPAIVAHTNGMSFSSGTLRGTYQWHVSAERMLATPEWNPETEAIHLPPDKAARLAREWLARHDLAHFELQSIQVFRYPAPYAGDPGVRLRKRFYYRLEYHSRQVEMMYVYVLLDGTILEPSLTPPKPK